MTNIEWTDATWNPIVGCSVISAGCANCYAMRQAGRLLDGNAKTPHYDGTTKTSNAGYVWTGKVAMAPDETLLAPLRWKKPRMIFVNSMGDLFHEAVPDAWIERVFAVMALSPQHTFQVLTKRPERMAEYLNDPRTPERIGSSLFSRVLAPHFYRGFAVMTLGLPTHQYITLPLPNVWLGVSVEDQKSANARIPHLLLTPAAVRFISAEPLLGPVDISRIAGRHFPIDARNGGWGVPHNDGSPLAGHRGLDWVIVGGESGKGARPMHPDWVRSLRDQCGPANIPFFFKQWGEWFSENGVPLKVGKKSAGRLLDGIEHSAMPETVK